MRLAARLSIIAILCVAVVFRFAAAQEPREKVVAAWEFDRDGDFEGWTGFGDVADATVAGGVLSVTTTGPDPQIVHDVFAEPLPATPTQALKIRIYSPGPGRAEFFWTNTTETKYGGFSPGKETFLYLNEGWGEYTVRPFWQAEGRIIKLRFDFPDGWIGRTYQIDYIRVIEMATGEGPVPADWDFDDGVQGWRVEGEGSLRAQDGWLEADLQAGARLVAPVVDAEAGQYSFVSFVMSVTAGTCARIRWACDRVNGLQQVDFPTIADGKPHTYNVVVGPGAKWTGKVIYLDLEPAVGAACQVRLDWLRASLDPIGPPDVEVRRLLIADPLPRAGRECEVLAWLACRGGPAEGLRAELTFGAGVRLAKGEQAVRKVEDLDYFSPAEVRWRVVADRPGEVRLRLKLSGPCDSTAEATDRVYPDLHLPKADYVPAPRPVRADYDVGIYYFPGWWNWDRWQPILSYPERKPVLGWYREGEPEVADWHLKWAAEHGVTFFCYDWYWDRGAMRLGHGLDAYFRARYRNLVKFCLLWANHDPTRHTPQDNEAVCRYWIENYFSRPEYYKYGGRPLLVIFSVGAMRRDLGTEGSRECIELWHRMTREAGVGEVLVAGCGNAAILQLMRDMGFDAVTGYNWPSCGAEGRNYVPYIEVARKQFDLWWMPMAQANLMPVIVPTTPGWDARPWHGQSAFVLTDRTPEAFEEHLRLAKRFVDETAQPRIVLIEAWNEFGEGSYCEPHKEFGFGHLDAVRRVFCPNAGPHDDYGPADVGLGPYDCEAPRRDRTAWEFDTEGDAQGWEIMMGMADLRVANGILEVRSLGTDPALSCATDIRADRVRAIEIRMSVSGDGRDDMAQIFWTTPLFGTSEEASVRVPIRDDGEMRVVRFEVGQNRFWRHRITSLRFDPCCTEGAIVRIDYVRLIP